MDWKFERVEQKFEQIKVGDHRVRIKEVSKQISQNGRDMIKLVFDVSGTNILLYNYIVFMDDRPEITNRKLTQLFDSFGIEDGNFNLNSWVGKVGAVNVKHDEEERAVVNYYINKNRQQNLPPWVEGNAETPTPKLGELYEVDDDDLPF